MPVQRQMTFAKVMQTITTVQIMQIISSMESSILLNISHTSRQASMPKGRAGVSSEVVEHLLLEVGDGLLEGGHLLVGEVGDGHSFLLELLNGRGLLVDKGLAAPVAGLAGALLEELLGLGLKALQTSVLAIKRSLS